MKLGVVMPSINLWDKYTSPAISSVAVAMGYAIGSGQVDDVGFLLIDNASTDGTKAGAEKILADDGEFTKRFEYHRNEEMWGFQRSVNFGARHFLDKGFDAVLVLNNDIILHNAAIERIAERINSGADFGGRKVGMVTCLDAAGECKGDASNLHRLNDVEKMMNCPEAPHPHFSAFAVTRECWDTVGEFDELFFPAYYEDNDYHHRMKLAGMEAVVCPAAMFFHFGSRTQNEALGRPLTQSQNQNMHYVRKWGGNPGSEVFPSPFNDGANSIKSTKQSPTA